MTLLSQPCQGITPVLAAAGLAGLSCTDDEAAEGEEEEVVPDDDEDSTWSDDFSS